MKTYFVTITKQGTVKVEAENEDDAAQIARDQEADGCFGMDIFVDVEEMK